MAALKLYLPYGALQRVADARMVTFHWFCVARPEPVAPYVSLIMGYRNLTDAARERAEAMVDEFLSEDEFHQLRSYLRERHGEDLRTTLLVAPVSAIKPDAGTHIGQERPFAQCVLGNGNGFHRLSEEEGYTMPFSVWGYYSLPTPMRAHAPAAATPALAIAAEPEGEADAESDAED
jgi:hypothetical protein